MNNRQWEALRACIQALLAQSRQDGERIQAVLRKSEQRLSDLETRE
jgi:hypothetical protein